MIYLSLGSNLGNRIQYLRRAVDLIKGRRYLKNVKHSIVLETNCILPVGAPSSWNKPFLNIVLAGEADIHPEELLVKLKALEHELGRPKEYEKWAPRVIDLDILLWANTRINGERLKIPHPELENRPFLLHLLSLMGADLTKRDSGALPSFTKALSLYPQLVGIVNVTEDSFSDGGEYDAPDKASVHTARLVADGASVIDIGAQSTRPGARMISPEEEYAKLELALDAIKSFVEKDGILISIDTFRPLVIQNALENYSISWINDVTGDLDDNTLRFIAEQGCKLCIMHSLGIPPMKDRIIPIDQRPMETLIDWARNKIDKLIKIGFREENIIIDPGIGFGKNPYQSLEILRDIEEFKTLGVSTLVGHSRKSFMRAFSTGAPHDRDIETIAVSGALVGKVDFLRVHNVEDHMRFLTARGILEK